MDFIFNMKSNIIIPAAVIISVLIFVPAVNPLQLITQSVGVQTGSNNSTTQTPAGRCGNNITSCGKYPDCQDLTNLKYCVRGWLIESICTVSSNQQEITNRTRSIKCNPDDYNNLNRPEVKFNVSDEDGNPQDVEISLLSPGTQNSFLTSSFTGSASLRSESPVSDVKFSFDDEKLEFTLKNVNLTKIASATSKIILMNADDIEHPSANIYRGYKIELPANLSYPITLDLSYDEISFSNQNNLRIYKCSQFNWNTNSCDVSWIEFGPDAYYKDASSKSVFLNISSFSVYGIGEYIPQTTTSTSTTWTTTTISTITVIETPTTTTTIIPTTSTSTSTTSSSTSTPFPEKKDIDTGNFANALISNQNILITLLVSIFGPFAALKIYSRLKY